MNVLVTGANGFLGRELVAGAVDAGYDTAALVRFDSDVDESTFHPSVSVVRGDLRYCGEWEDALRSSDVVVHAAAAAGGERSAQLASTVVGTENLLDALRDVSLKRFVHVSSYSVYDYRSPRRGDRLDEETALEVRPHERDAYTEAKLVQEQLVREWCETHDVPCVIVRPGAIVGPGRSWNHGAAFTIGRLSFVVAPRATFRIISVVNCAEAIVKAVGIETGGPETINLVDDDLPTNSEYFRLCRRAGAPTGIMVPVPWLLLDITGRLIHSAGSRLTHGRLHMPELLDHRRQEARWKPLRYPNDRAHRMLAWHSKQSLEDAVRSAEATFESLDHA